MHADRMQVISVTAEEREGIENERQLSDVHSRLMRIVETVYDAVGYGEIVVSDPDTRSVHGNVGYLSISAGQDGICASFDPNDRDKDRHCLDWPLSTDDDVIIGDLVAELREAAQHRRLGYVARWAVDACLQIDPDRLWALSNDAIISAFVSAVTGS